MTSSEPVFIDTSGWIALLNSDEQLHARAGDLWRVFVSRKQPLLTTDWVIAETGNGLARFKSRSLLFHAVQAFLDSSYCTLIRVSEDRFSLALESYHRFRDKEWGLVDCASFLAMREQGARLAFSADHHFEQAGFECLLR